MTGQTVELERRGETLVIWARGQEVARHPLGTGRHQVRLLPEHGPGAIARTQRRARSGQPSSESRWAGPVEVEVRDLGLYEQLAGATEVAA